MQNRPAAYSPFPGDARFFVLETHGLPGTRFQRHQRQSNVVFRDFENQGLLVPVEVQPENRRAMPWADYLHGVRLAAGARIGPGAS